MFDRDAWPRILPFAAYLAIIVVTDLLLRLGVPAADLRWMYAVKIAVVLGLLLWFRRSYTELAGPWPGLGTLGVAVATGVVVLVLWINLNAGWMHIGAPTGFDPRNNGTLDWPLAMVRLAGAALVVPVMEELFWRSFLMRWVQLPRFLELRPAAVGLKALAVSAVLFGIEHDLWLAGIIAGVAYSLLYIRSGKLWAPTLAHGVTNGLLGGWIIATGNWTYW